MRGSRLDACCRQNFKQLVFLIKNEASQAKECNHRAGLPKKTPSLQLEKLLQAMKHDKKFYRAK